MLLINKAIITENNTLVSVGSFAHKGSTELKGIVIFQTDNSLHDLLIEDATIIYDVIEYKPNLILILVSDGNGNCSIRTFYITGIFCRMDNILPIFKEEYRFAKTADGVVILYYNLPSPNCETKSITITLKDDLIYQSVVVVDQIIHSDNAINEYRPNKIWDFNLDDITPLKNRIRLATDTQPAHRNDKTILILRFTSQHAEFSSHDIITIGENDVLVNYQVCHNKLIIICRNEFEGELINKIYICKYQESADHLTLIQDGTISKINLTISE